MSGIAFQKSNGDGSIAFEQLMELKKLNKSELYKLAKEFAPDLELTAVTKTFYIGFNENAETVLNFDGRYFGYFYCSLSLMRTANSDNGYKSSWARVYDGNAMVNQTTRMVHGDDILSWGSVHNSFIGFGTAMMLNRFDNQTNQHSFHVQFIGYKLGDAVENPSEPVNVPIYASNGGFHAISLTDSDNNISYSSGLGSATTLDKLKVYQLKEINGNVMTAYWVDMVNKTIEFIGSGSNIPVQPKADKRLMVVNDPMNIHPGLVWFNFSNDFDNCGVTFATESSTAPLYFTDVWGKEDDIMYTYAGWTITEVSSPVGICKAILVRDLITPLSLPQVATPETSDILFGVVFPA